MTKPKPDKKIEINRIDDGATVNKIRQGMKGRRLVMSEDGMIFAPTLEDIKKHNYRLIEDTPEEEGDDPQMQEAMREVKKGLVHLNAILESDDNKIET